MNTIDKIAEFFNANSEFHGQIKTDEKLSSHTTMHTGGNARLFFEPLDFESLIFAAKKLQDEKIDFFLLGGGSNVIISDKGLYAVISTRKLNSVNKAISKEPEHSAVISVGSGSSWGNVISFCKKNNLGGFESFTGLSGTVGGALFMNATCFGLNACDNLVSAEYFDLTDLQIHTYKKIDSDWDYKKSPFQSASCKKIILSAVFCVSDGFDLKKSEECMLFRKEKGHFRSPSAGSAFKNDSSKGIIAGKIIDECGLKGFSVGGAQIAPWHGNFIINPEQKASSEDIKRLSDYVKKIVLEKKGIKLENEILFID